MFGQKPYEPGFTVQAREHSQYRQLKDAIQRDTSAAIKKFKPFAVVQCVVAFLAIIFGAVLIAVSVSNIGFPIFNVGPLVTGVLELVTGLILLCTTRIDVGDTERPRFNKLMKAHLILNLLVSVVAAVSLTIAFIAVSVCLKLEEEYFYYTDAGVRKTYDVEQYCHPHSDAKIALSFLSGLACTVVFLWNSYGLCFYCTYGMLFGMGWKGKL